MRYSTNIKPISYVKAHAAQVLDDLAAGGAPLVITRNGEACAVLQDVKSYEAQRETMVLLKLLALGQQDIADGRIRPLDEAVRRTRACHGLGKGPASDRLDSRGPTPDPSLPREQGPRSSSDRR